MELNPVPKVLAFAALCSWFGFIFLSLQYNSTRPTHPIQAEGRIHPSNNHGHIAYLTQQEQSRLDELQLGALLLFGVAAVAAYFQKNPKSIEEVRQLSLRCLYTAVHPSSWPALGTSLRSHLPGMRISDIIATPASPRNVSLHTDLPMSTCQTNLRRTIELNTIGVVGEVGKHRFHMCVYRKDLRNSFKPYFYGRLSTTASGTRITGKFQMHWFVRIFLFMWLVGLIFVATKMAAMAFPDRGSSPYMIVSFLAALGICALLIVRLGKTLGADEKSQMYGFLLRTLQAQPETPMGVQKSRV